MTGNYNRFFTIDLLHEYFLDGKSQDIEIVPTENCKALARNIGLQFRFFQNRLISLIKVNEDDEPYVNIPGSKFYRKHYGNAVFRFYIKNKNPLFFNFTNTGNTLSSRKKFYFSNLSHNELNGVLYL